jgi:phosphoenolpyruvate synthase/pyruvate phosphate dikinase
MNAQENIHTSFRKKEEHEEPKKTSTPHYYYSNIQSYVEHYYEELYDAHYEEDKEALSYLVKAIKEKDVDWFKDDYEKTLQYSKLDGGVCRFNYICCKTVMYKGGGLNLKKQERLQHNIESSQYLLKEFPGYVKLNPKKMGEILLRTPKAGV